MSGRVTGRVWPDDYPEPEAETMWARLEETAVPPVPPPDEPSRWSLILWAAVALLAEAAFLIAFAVWVLGAVRR